MMKIIRIWKYNRQQSKWENALAKSLSKGNK